MILFKKLVWKRTFSLFREKNLALVAAASSFFFMLTLIPFLILLMKTASLFFSRMNDFELKIFEMLKTFLPETSPELLGTFQKIIHQALFKKGGEGFGLSILFTILGSLSLFGSLSKGLELIGGNTKKAAFKKLEDFFFVGVSVIFAILCLTLPSLFGAIESLMGNMAVITQLHQIFPEMKSMFSSLGFLTTSKYLFPLILWVYIAILFSWYFKFKLRIRDFLLVSFIFLLILNIAKGLFLIYIKMVSGGMLSNYGSLYTYILAMLWIYLVMIAFYFSACLCQAKIWIGKEDGAH